MTKYKVLIYPRPYEYENIEAGSPGDAEDIATRHAYQGDYDDILKTEVFITCTECNWDNVPGYKKCEDCGVIPCEGCGQPILEDDAHVDNRHATCI